MKIKGIIFDLDGVLVFTDKFHYQAWKCLTDKLDIEFDEEMNHCLRGVSRMESLEIILEKYTGKALSEKQKQELAEEKNNIYIELLKTMSPKDVSMEVRGVLKELKKKNYKMAIGSSSRNAKFILERVQLIDAFDAISDGTNIAKSKPDPEVFLKAAELLGLQPNECAVVEDAYAGIDAAKAGQMTAFAVGNAVNYEKSDYRLESLADIVDILDNHANCDEMGEKYVRRIKEPDL